MFKLIIGLIIGYILSTSVAFTRIIDSPPPLPGEPVAEQNYLYKIYRNMHNLEILTTTPNGNTKGNAGDLILFNNSGTYTIHVNTDSEKTWQAL